MRAAAGEATAIAKSAVTASVAEPLRTCLCIGFLPRGSVKRTNPPFKSALHDAGGQIRMTERLYNCLVGDFPSMKPGGDGGPPTFGGALDSEPASPPLRACALPLLGKQPSQFGKRIGQSSLIPVSY